MGVILSFFSQGAALLSVVYTGMIGYHSLRFSTAYAIRLSDLHFYTFICRGVCIWITKSRVIAFLFIHRLL